MPPRHLLPQAHTRFPARKFKRRFRPTIPPPTTPTSVFTVPRTTRAPPTSVVAHTVGYCYACFFDFQKRFAYRKLSDPCTFSVNIWVVGYIILNIGSVSLLGFVAFALTACTAVCRSFALSAARDSPRLHDLIEHVFCRGSNAQRRTRQRPTDGRPSIDGGNTTDLIQLQQTSPALESSSLVGQHRTSLSR